MDSNVGLLGEVGVGVIGCEPKDTVPALWFGVTIEGIVVGEIPAFAAEMLAADVGPDANDTVFGNTPELLDDCCEGEPKTLFELS